MKIVDEIDFMIKSLQIAKEEIEYAEEFNKGVDSDKKKDLKAWEWGSYQKTHRNPNGTLIRENLRTVSRLSSIVANKVKLSPYHSEVE